MTTNIANQVSFLRTTRAFPKDLENLTIEIDKAYLDIATAVNYRTISLFPTTKSAVNGESWYLTDNRRQQGLRQVYPFTATGNIPHGINLSNKIVSKPSGTFTDGTNWYGAIYGSSTAIAGQISFYVDPTNIVILAGVGAPTITSGLIILEWLSQP